MDRRLFLQAVPAFWAGAAAPWLSACQGGGRDAQTQSPTPLAGSQLPPTDELTHLVGRTRFATTAQDLERARELGPEGYLEQQLQAPAGLDPVYLQADAQYPLTVLPAPLTPVAAAIREQATAQLAERTLFLAAYSDQQLFELMVDFWTNHFNIENVTGDLPLHKLYDDREVIRRHAYGRFPEMLHASAKSPAMLEYLDNQSNVAEGPNENYARELMELHTLGVDGGYTEKDVREVARCFTGWGIDGVSREFVFRPELHDDGEKVVLGTVIPAGGGVADGERVLDLLAAHPSTGRFLGRKLARRFVADEPPAQLVEDLAAEYARTQGDIPAMLRRLFTSAEFFAARDRKFRRPLEYVASVLRLTTAPMQPEDFDGPALLQLLSRMGQIPHRWFPPDGYPDTAGYWMNTAVMLESWNFAAAQVETARLLSGAAVTPGDAGDLATLADQLAWQLTQRTLRPADRDTLVLLAQTLADGPPVQQQAELIGGLLLASPAFMLR